MFSHKTLLINALVFYRLVSQNLCELINAREQHFLSTRCLTSGDTTIISSYIYKKNFSPLCWFVLHHRTSPRSVCFVSKLRRLTGIQLITVESVQTGKCFPAGGVWVKGGTGRIAAIWLSGGICHVPQSAYQCLLGSLLFLLTINRLYRDSPLWASSYYWFWFENVTGFAQSGG